MGQAENYRRVKAELDRRRGAAVAAAEEHLNALHALSPESVELDDALSRTATRVFEAAVAGGDVAGKVAAIRRENEGLLAARKTLLSGLGLPTDYTDPHYTCPLCGDTGYVMTKMCSCMRTLLQLEGFRSGGVSAQVDTQTFDAFSLDYYRGDDRACMEKTLAVARHFADTFTPGKENLLLMGGTGLGKTHLSTAVARRVIEAGYAVVYETVQTVLSDFEYDRFRNSYSAETGRAEKYLTVDLLILDDLGTEFGNQFTVACLYQIVNTRLVRGLSTVISTNLTAQDIKNQYGDRLTSRLLGNYQPLRFVGEDIRFQKLKH